MGIILKSAFEPYDLKDGTRYLVESLWPKGVSALSLSPYTWVQQLAPSYYLKEKAIWDYWSQAQFRHNYNEELHEPNRLVWFNQVVSDAREGTVTLLHNSRKKEWEIRPEDTTAYYLIEFLHIELEKQHELCVLSARQANVKGRHASANKNLGAWFNEGGK